MVWPLLVVAALIGARRWLDVIEVRGRSMAPTLLPGDRLLAVRLRRSPRAGEIVLAPDPRDAARELVKRVARAGASGLALLGDNPSASADARTFGVVPPAAVEWRVVLRYWPRQRIGRLPARPCAFAELEPGGEAACAFPEAPIAGEGASPVSRA
ncbi:MAG: nickel-type superoxide dismutase maturation protease [Chloroflexota bacterium]|nr:nickel-type superoxide dismutase maturation protease [Chloroflexota bacterium]